MRVDESWRSNASESCNSHQLSSSFDQAFITMHARDEKLKKHAKVSFSHIFACFLTGHHYFQPFDHERRDLKSSFDGSTFRLDPSSKV